MGNFLLTVWDTSFSDATWTTTDIPGCSVADHLSVAVVNPVLPGVKIAAFFDNRGPSSEATVLDLRARLLDENPAGEEIAPKAQAARAATNSILMRLAVENFCD